MASMLFFRRSGHYILMRKFSKKTTNQRSVETIIFKPPMAEHVAFPDFGCNCGANSMDTMDVIETIDKTARFSETQWTLTHAIDRFTRERLVNPAGPTLTSQKCGAFRLYLHLGAVCDFL